MVKKTASRNNPEKKKREKISGQFAQPDKKPSRIPSDWFQKLFQHHTDAIILHDSRGKLVDANPPAAKLFGYSRKQFLTLTFTQLIREEMRDEASAILQQISKSGNLTFEMEFCRKQGQLFSAEVASSCFTHDTDQIWSHAVRDISPRKNLEQELKDSHRKLSSIIRSVPDIIYRLDTHSCITYISDTIREYGYQPQELIGKNIFDIIHPEDRSKALYRINERRTGERRTRSFEIRLKAKNKKYVPFDVHATGIYIEPTFLIEAEGIYSTDIPEARSFLGSQGVARDITERKITEKILQDSEQRLKSILSSMMDTILVFDEKGRIANHHSQNDSCFMPPEKYINKTPGEVFPRHVSQMFEKALNANQRNQTEETEFWMQENQDLQWYSVKFSPMFVEEKYKGSVAVVRNVTARKKDEESLLRKSQQQENLLQTLKYLTESLNLTEVLTRIGHAAKDILKADGCTIYLLEPDGITLSPVVALEQRYTDEILATPLTIHNSFTGKSVQAGKSLIFNHAQDNPTGFHIPGTPEDEEENLIVSPFIVDNRVLGAVCLDRRKRKFLADDLRLTETFGTLAATALKNAKAHSDLQNEIEKNIAITRQLADSEEKFRNLAEESPNMIFINVGGKVAYANRRCEEIMGYKRKDFYSPDFNFFDLVDPKAHDLIRNNFKRHGQGEEIQPYEYTLITKNKKRIDSLITTKLITYDREKAILGIITDIGDRKRAEEALRKSEEKYRKFFEEDLTGDFISNPEGKILACNSAFLKIFGFASKKKALKSRLASLYNDTRHWKSFLQLLVVKKKLEYHEMELRRVDGQQVHIIANMTGKFDKKGKLTEIMGYLFDNTERKVLEQQFRQAQKMEAVGRLAGGVAHDFNNLLTIISGYSELILHRRSPDKRLNKDVQQIKKAGDKASQLTNQLLAFSRRQVRQLKLINLNSVVMDVNKMLHRLIGEDIQLLLQLDPDLWTINADTAQLEQILMNLAVNARDAMPQGGKLIIETSNVTYQKDHVQKNLAVQPAGSYVMLAIHDTGSGMDEETRSHIFEPFFTTKPYGKGTGLGLSTVYGIVKQSDGYIWVDSEPKKGTSFRVYFPRVQVKAKKYPSPLEIQQAQRGSETLLLVEDEDMVRELSARVLQDAGYTVLVSSHGEEALRLATEQKGTIDMIITDVIMPGISGRKLAEGIQKNRPEIKVLFISGYTDEIISQQGNLEEGMNFLQKPFSPQKFLITVRQILDRKP